MEEKSYRLNMKKIPSVLCMAFGSFVLFFLLDLYTRPEFIRRAVIAYKNMAYEKLTQKGITSFRDESTAAYISALSNDVTSIEANYLSQLFSLVSKLVMFFGSVILMVLYSPILTLISPRKS